jgi:hypothetical protein
MDADEDAAAVDTPQIIAQSLELVLEDATQLESVFSEVCRYHTDEDKSTRLSVIRFLLEVAKRHPGQVAVVCGVLETLLTDDDTEVTVRCILAANQLYRAFFFRVMPMKPAEAEEFRDHWRALINLKTAALHYASSGGRKPGTLAQAPTRALVSAAALRFYETVVESTLVAAPPGINTDGAPKKCIWEDYEYYIHAPHPLLDRDTLNKSAELLFKELLNWAQMGGTAGAATTHNPGGFFSKEQYVVCLGALHKVALKSPPHFKKVADAFHRLLSREGRPRRREGVLSDVQAGMVLSTLRSLCLFMVAHSKKGTAALRLTPVQERDRRDATEKLIQALAANAMAEHVKLVMPEAADLVFLVGEDMAPESITSPPSTATEGAPQPVHGSGHTGPRSKVADPRTRKRANLDTQGPSDVAKGSNMSLNAEVPVSFVPEGAGGLRRDVCLGHAREARLRIRDGSGDTLSLQLGSRSALREALLARLGAMTDEMAGQLANPEMNAPSSRRAAPPATAAAAATVGVLAHPTVWETVEHCLEDNLTFIAQRSGLLLTLLYELFTRDTVLSRKSPASAFGGGGAGESVAPSTYELVLRKVILRLQEKVSRGKFKYVNRLLLEVPAIPFSILDAVKQCVAGADVSAAGVKNGLKILKVCCLERSGPQELRLHALDCTLDLACHPMEQVRKEATDNLVGHLWPSPELKRCVEMRALLLLDRVHDMLQVDVKRKALAGAKAVKEAKAIKTLESGGGEGGGEKDEGQDEDEPLVDEDASAPSDWMQQVLSLPKSTTAMVEASAGEGLPTPTALPSSVPALDDRTMLRLYAFPVALSGHVEAIFTKIFFLYAAAAPAAATTAAGLASAETAARSAATEKRKQHVSDAMEEENGQDDENFKAETAAAVAAALELLPTSPGVVKHAVEDSLRQVVKFASENYGKVNVMRLVSSAPEPAANPLIFRTLEYLASSSELSSLLPEAQELLRTAVALEQQRKRNVRYLVPFLGAADIHQFSAILPRLLPWTQKDLEDPSYKVWSYFKYMRVRPRTISLRFFLLICADEIDCVPTLFFFVHLDADLIGAIDEAHNCRGGALEHSEF